MSPRALPRACLVMMLAVLLGSSADSQIVDSFDPAPDGEVYTSVPMPDGSILVGGPFWTIDGQPRSSVARLFQNGAVDSSFTHGRFFSGYASPVAPYIGCLALQTNGQVVIAGLFYGGVGPDWCNGVARMNPDSTMDSNFNHAYTNFNPSAIANCLAIQPDGKIIVGCSFSSPAPPYTVLYRLNGDGTLDANFTATAQNRSFCCVFSVAVQPDGKILVGGDFTNFDNQSLAGLARLNSDGSVDASFQPTQITHGLGSINAVQIQPDGKIVVGGFFNEVNGQAHTNIVRFNANGSLDTDFNAQSAGVVSPPTFGFGVWALVSQADGRIIVGNDTATSDGVACPYLSRLNSDGSLDRTFSTNLVDGEVIYAVALQADGKILVGGQMVELGGQFRPHLGRLINTEAATQSLTYDGTNIIWLRGGTSPEVWRTSFESSADGTNWTYLGDGARVNGEWQLGNVAALTNAMIRARGFATGGEYNGSSWFVETVYPATTPQFVTDDGNLGCRTNQFGCSIGGSAGSTVEIDESSDFLNWTAFATNLVYSRPVYFTDPSSTNTPQRFYRLRLQ